MATVDKAFRIKNGLVVEGTTATVNGSNVLTEASTSTVSNKTINIDPSTGNVFQIQSNGISSYVGSGNTVVLSSSPTITTPYINSGLYLNGATTGVTALVAANTASGTITFPAVTGTVVTTGDTGSVSNTMLANSAITINGVSTSLGGTRTLNTDDVGEGSTNKYFTDERAQDAIATAIANGTQTNISVTYDDTTNAFNFNATGGVASLSGTANEVEVTNVGTAFTVGLPNDITVAGNITINGTPTNPTHAATKQYVDDVAQGLHVHASCVTATTSNLDAIYSNGTSGVGATLTNNGTQAALVIDGVTVIVGDRVLVKNQTSQPQNGIYTVTNVGSVSTNWILTRASDFDTSVEIDGGDFTFVTGGAVNDNTGWVQVETGVTIGSSNIIFNQFSGAGTYLAGNGLTLTGNVFTIDTAITADLSSAQSLTNKTLTSPTITSPTVSGLYLSDNNIVIEGTPDTYETTLTFTNPTDDRTITFKNESGTVAYLTDIESAVDYFGGAVTSTTGISVSYASTSNVLTIGNTGVTSIAGTTDQITATTSTGSVTLSLPQSIATTSIPTFAGVSVGSGSLTAGSVTLADALLGSATTSISSTSATVVDSWSSSAYSSAKYIVQMKNGTDIETLEVLVNIDGNDNVYITEYADVISNAQLGTTNADFSAGNVRLLVTSTSGTTVKVHKTLIEA